MSLYLHASSFCIDVHVLYVSVCIFLYLKYRIMQIHTHTYNTYWHMHIGVKRYTHMHMLYVTYYVYVSYPCMHAIHTCIFGHIHICTCRIADEAGACSDSSLCGKNAFVVGTKTGRKWYNSDVLMTCVQTLRTIYRSPPGGTLQNIF